MKWAREEQKADKARFEIDEWEERFEERCPVLFGLLATVNKKLKRTADATVAHNTVKATDDQKASIAGQLARGKALIDARTARRDGLATDTQIRLLAPEVASDEALIDARTARRDGLATDTQIRLLAPEVARGEALIDIPA